MNVPVAEYQQVDPPSGKTAGRAWLAVLGVIASLGATTAALLYYRHAHRTDSATETEKFAAAPQPPLADFFGLSEAEAAARLTIDPTAIRAERMARIDQRYPLRLPNLGMTSA